LWLGFREGSVQGTAVIFGVRAAGHAAHIRSLEKIARRGKFEKGTGLWLRGARSEAGCGARSRGQGARSHLAARGAAVLGVALRGAAWGLQPVTRCHGGSWLASVLWLLTG
jgi:hypothetical protein